MWLCVENNQDLFQNQMRLMMQLLPESLKDMGERGERLIRENYTWGTATENIIEKYHTLLRIKEI